jgi:hypothetical protein
VKITGFPEGRHVIDPEIPDGKKVDVNDDGLTVYLKVNYRVVLLVVVIFDIFHTSLNEIVIHTFGH